MNSFIGWIGGKSRLRKYIIPLIPPETTRYIEVFGGGGWVLFGKEKVKNQLEVFNDIDSNLINLYRQIKNNCTELQKEIDWLQSRELFNLYKNELKLNVRLTDAQRAARYLYLIKCSFGSNRSSFATDKKSMSNVIDSLPKYRDRLKDVVIEHCGYEQIIKTYDRPGACFYLDPPYVGTEKYYNADFTTSDHKRLNTLLRGLKGRFILSYNDCEFVRDLYNNYNITSISRANLLSAGDNSKEFRELIITNFT